MISMEHGIVTIEGQETELLAETMMILDSIYRMLRKNHGEEYAKAKIESLGRLYVDNREEWERKRSPGKKN